MATLMRRKKRFFFLINSRANKVIWQNKAMNYSNYTDMKTILARQIFLFVTLTYVVFETNFSKAIVFRNQTVFSCVFARSQAQGRLKKTLPVPPKISGPNP